MTHSSILCHSCKEGLSINSSHTFSFLQVRNIVHSSMSNIPSSRRHDAFRGAVSFNGARLDREGRLLSERLEVLDEPIAELQLVEGPFDEEQLEQLELSEPLPMPHLQPLELSAMTSHSSFCLLDGSSESIRLA